MDIEIHAHRKRDRLHGFENLLQWNLENIDLDLNQVSRNGCHLRSFAYETYSRTREHSLTSFSIGAGWFGLA